MSTLKVIHDRQKCIGCNSCVSIAPQSWMMDPKEGKSFLVGSRKNGRFYIGEIFDCDEELNKEAAEACPMRIIKILDPVDQIREKIGKIDKELISLLAKRFVLAQQLGQIKKKKSIPVIDKSREKVLFANWEKVASENGINPELIMKIWKLILTESIRIQFNQ